MRLGSLLVLSALSVPVAVAASAGVARAQPQDEVASAKTLLVSSPRLVAWLRARSATVRAATERTQQANAEARQAGVSPNPTLALEFGTIPLGATNPPGFGIADTAHVTVGVNQVVELGKRGPRKRSAELRARAAGEEGVGTLADRLGDARLSLARAVYARAKLAALTENLRSARELS